ncbi:MAG: hypothetical protein ACYTF1_09320 [Planctomycetota bacterium]|jgi:hypothetical protein
MFFVYHIYVICLILLIVMPIVGGAAYFKLDYYAYGRQEHLWYFYGSVIIWPILVILTFGRWVRRRLKKKMDVMQREVAVRIARDRQRREIQWSWVDTKLEKQYREGNHHGE